MRSSALGTPPTVLTCADGSSVVAQEANGGWSCCWEGASHLRAVAGSRAGGRSGGRRAPAGAVAGFESVEEERGR